RYVEVLNQHQLFAARGARDLLDPLHLYIDASLSLLTHGTRDRAGLSRSKSVRGYDLQDHGTRPRLLELNLVDTSQLGKVRGAERRHGDEPVVIADHEVLQAAFDPRNTKPRGAGHAWRFCPRSEVASAVTDERHDIVVERCANELADCAGLLDDAAAIV